MISFDEFILEDSGPVYLQIIRYIKQGIASGSIGSREEVPSRRALSTLLGVNPNTIQKAYAELERCGVVYSIPGRGSFVTSQPDRVTELHRKQLMDEVAVTLKKAKSHGLTKDIILFTVSEIWDEN